MGVEDFGVYKLYSRNKRRVDADKVVKVERSSLGCATRRVYSNYRAKSLIKFTNLGTLNFDF